MHRLGWSKPRAGCGRWLSVRKDASLMSGCPACPSCTRGRRAMFLKKLFFFFFLTEEAMSYSAFLTF